MRLRHLVLFLMSCCWVFTGWASSFPNLDSLMAQNPGMPAFQVESHWLKQHPMLQPKPNDVVQIRVRKDYNRTGLFLSAVLLLYVFAGFRLFFGKNLQDAFSWLRKVEDTSNNRRSLNTDVRYAGIFSFLYLACMAYVLYHYIVTSKIPMEFHAKGSLLLFSVFLCFGLYLLKYFLQRVLVWTFLSKEVYDEYRTNLNSITQIASVILFPICIVMLLSSGRFFQVILYTAIAVIGFITLWRYARMIGSLKKIMSIDFVHFFLYLCAFEILPILAAGRFMIR